MTSDPASDGATPLDAARRIDRICDAFEAEWRAGAGPRIEEILPGNGLDEDALFRELLTAEVIRRRASGETPGLDEYAERFPDRIDVVRSVLDPSVPTHMQSAETVPCVVGPGGWPTRLGDYELLEQLGRGGMGVVHLARQTSLDRLVALKTIRSADLASPEQVERFLNEPRLVASVGHPGIVPVYDSGEQLGVCWFSMEYVPGRSLGEVLAEGAVEQRVAAGYVRDLAEAIAAAHAKGVLHRDLKPSNVMLADDGTVRVLDFGLGRQIDSDLDLSRSGQIAGTASYMPPEQATGGLRNSGPANDVYGLGAVLYALLTGHPPFRAADLFQTIQLVIETEPVPPRRVNPRISRDLETICLKCLEKRPDRRYASARGLLEDLARFLDHRPILARPATPFERMGKWARRRPATAALVVVSTLAVLGFTGTVVGYNFALRKSLDESERLRGVAEENEADAIENAELAERRRVRAERLLYGTRLSEIGEAAADDPMTALESLRDPDRCPPDLRDFTWRLLERVADRERGRWHDHASAVRCIATDPAGELVVTGDADGRVVWRGVGDSRPRGTIDVPGPINAVACDRSGGTLAIAGDEPWLVDTVNGERRQLAGHTDTVNHVTFSPDGETLATASADRTIRLWDVETGEPRTTLNGHENSVFSVDFDPRGEWLASAGRDGVGRIWHLGDDEPAALLEGHRGWITDIAFGPDGERVATVGIDRTVRLWSRDGESLGIVGRHDGTVSAVVFTPDGRIVSAGHDGTIRVWAPGNAGSVVLRLPEERIAGVAFVAENRVASIFEDGTTRFHGIEPEWSKPFRIPTERPVVSTAVVDALGIAVVEFDGRLVLHDLADGRATVLATEGVQHVVTAGGRLASAHEDGFVRTWSLDDVEPEAELPLIDLWANGIDASANGMRIIVAPAGSRSVVLWDNEARETRAIYALEREATAVALGRSGDRLAAGDETGKVVVWEPGFEQISLEQSFGPAPIRRLKWSPDEGSSLFVLSNAIWRVMGDNATRLDSTAGSPVVAFDLAQDGRTLATIESDGTVQLLDAELGVRRLRLNSNVAEPIDLAFTPDGDALVAVGVDGTVQEWSLAGPQSRRPTTTGDRRIP